MRPFSTVFPTFLFKNGVLRGAFAAIALAVALPCVHAATESLPERELKGIVERQKRILDDAAKAGNDLDAESLRVQAQAICNDYELLLRNSPNFAAGFAAYGYFLREMEMPKESIAIFLKANQLDPNIPMVKNEIGNYLAEAGKPIEAENYFRAAISLAPTEPLYHYELGRLLHDARDDFIKTGNWTPQQIDDASHKAFERAAELAPDQIAFTYRYAESFYDMDKPDWDAALKEWAALEEKEPPGVGRQMIRLQAANILIKEGRYDAAKVLIATVTEPKLDPQKQKLIAQFPENAKH